MFGREAIIDGDYGNVERAGGFGAIGLVCLEVADNEPATVIENHDGTGRAAFACVVKPCGNRPGGSGNRQVLDNSKRAGFGFGDGPHCDHLGACGHRIEFVNLWTGQIVEEGEEHLDVGAVDGGHRAFPLVRLRFAT